MMTSPAEIAAQMLDGWVALPVGVTAMTLSEFESRFSVPPYYVFTTSWPKVTAHDIRWLVGANVYKGSKQVLYHEETLDEFPSDVLLAKMMLLVG